MQTVVETPTYLSAAEKLFSEEERADIVLTVAADPEYGEVMKGTGGYIQRDNTVPVFLIAVFPKNEKENLTKAERNALKKRADTIFENYRRR